jgi:hypothetical protein
VKIRNNGTSIEGVEDEEFPDIAGSPVFVGFTSIVANASGGRCFPIYVRVVCPLTIWYAYQ